VSGNSGNDPTRPKTDDADDMNMLQPMAGTPIEPAEHGQIDVVWYEGYPHIVTDSEAYRLTEEHAELIAGGLTKDHD